MNDHADSKRTRIMRVERLDKFAFTAAFFLGVVIYFLLLWILNLGQILVTACILVIMVSYAFLITNVPRLRVRPDQAGDNAYYLGLLFTLVSMAGALIAIGPAFAGNDIDTGKAAQGIIANFGIALFSTIMGIFLRVRLNLIRIDPSDVEQETRLELTEASKRVRASLDSVVLDLQSFCNELKQRNSDLTELAVDGAKKMAEGFWKEMESTAHEMLTSIQKSESEVLRETQKLVQLIENTSIAAIAANERLRAVEPPPVLLSRRLTKISDLLEATAESTSQISGNMADTATHASAALECIDGALTGLTEVSTKLGNSFESVRETLEASVQRVSKALETVGAQLEANSSGLANIREQTAMTIKETERAQSAALEVLRRLTEVTRGLIDVVREAKAS